MSVYLDASILVSLFVHDASSARADALLRGTRQVVIVSDLAGSEFASALARRTRTGEQTIEDARTALANFDLWIAQAVHRVETTAQDVATATSFIRRLDLALRTPDAIHIAITQRCGASLATFDQKMQASAEALGLVVAPA